MFDRQSRPPRHHVPGHQVSGHQVPERRESELRDRGYDRRCSPSRRSTLALLLLLLAATSSLAHGARALQEVEAPAEVRLTEVATGVYAMLQPAAMRFNDSNSVVIVTERDVMVVDAQADSSTVESLYEKILELTDLPISWLINTHWHADHSQSNATWKRLVGDQLRIVGHESLRTDIPTRTQALLDEQIERLSGVLPRAEANLAEGKGLAGQDLDASQRETQKLAIEQGKAQLEELRRVELLVPDVTYRSVLRLERDSGDVVLLHMPGHTAGDTVVWLPEQRVLITGDLLDEVPFGGHGTPSAIQRSLDHLSGYFPAIVVPGHGPIQRDRERLDLVRELWSKLLRHCRDQQQLGRSLDQTRDALDLGDLRARMTGGEPVAERNFDGFLPDNLERACADMADTLE